MTQKSHFWACISKTSKQSLGGIKRTPVLWQQFAQWPKGGQPKCPQMDEWIDNT